MAEHLSPKDLELKAGLRDCLRTVMGMSFGAVFEQSEDEFFGIVFGQSRLNLGLISGSLRLENLGVL